VAATEGLQLTVLGVEFLMEFQEFA